MATTPFSSTTSPHFNLMVMIAEVIFVSVLALLSQVNAQWETVIMTFLVGLWLVFLVNQGPTLVSKFAIRN